MPNKSQHRSPSYRSRLYEQLFRKPMRLMQQMSSFISQNKRCFGSGEAEIVFQEKISNEIDVYDIQVEGNHNFFANDILVHNCLLSDDLIDAKDAFSKLKRESIRHWYEFVFFGRAQNRNTVKRININQRLHPKDISDLTVNHFGFPSLVIQMVKTNKNLGTIEYEDPRQAGEFLFPSRYGQKEMDEDRKNTNKWSSQYQQEPLSQSGGIIKEEWLKYYDSAPSFDKIVIVGDLNFKPSQDSDYAAFACWGRQGYNKYLIDMVRGRWTYAQTKSMFESFTNKHGNANNIYIEGKANGQALLSDFAGKVKGMQEWPFNNPQLSRASKVERLYMVSQEFEQGNVYLPTNLSIMEPYLEELLSFSENGSATGHDDMVDTTSMALIELRKKKSFIG